MNGKDKSLIRDYVKATTGASRVTIGNGGIVRANTKPPYAEDEALVLANARSWEQAPLAKKAYR